MDVEKAIRDYLPQIVHMSLATCDGDKPWVCEVHFVYDDDLNLYFRSLQSRRHSKEIAKNPNVAGNIIKQHELGNPVRGVYFEGQAEKLDDVTEDSAVYRLFCERLGCGPSILEEARSEAGHAFYKISVEDFYLFDSIESKSSQKYQLPWSPARRAE